MGGRRMLALKDLQAKVNEIAEEVNGLDTNAKLDWARARARHDKELYGLFLAIVDEALTKRWNQDMRASIAKFLDVVKEAEE
jgi:hypothetical protein